MNASPDASDHYTNPIDLRPTTMALLVRESVAPQGVTPGEGAEGGDGNAGSTPAQATADPKHRYDLRMAMHIIRKPDSAYWITPPTVAQCEMDAEDGLTLDEWLANDHVAIRRHFPAFQRHCVEALSRSLDRMLRK